MLVLLESAVQTRAQYVFHSWDRTPAHRWYDDLTSNTHGGYRTSTNLLHNYRGYLESTKMNVLRMVKLVLLEMQRRGQLSAASFYF
jgi:hypothetical protein